MASNRLSKFTDKDFIQAFKRFGPTELARRYGIKERAVYARRQRLERKYRINLAIPDETKSRASSYRPAEHPHRLSLQITDGTVLVGSDAHIWPGPKTTAIRGFIKFIKHLKPKAVVMNGDVMDFPGISRHPPIGWEGHPEVEEEIEAAKDTLHDIAVAAGRARKVWTLGNHDARFETRLATAAPQYRKVHGVHLSDHFPLWEPCWAVWINDVVIKHIGNSRGGYHAAFNNTVKSGKHIVTGHLHSAQVTAWTDYNGTRYGVDCGCLADPNHKAFVDYTEDNSKNWRSGFCVLKFHKGKLLQPQLALVLDDHHMDYCGEVIKV